MKFFFFFFLVVVEKGMKILLSNKNYFMIDRDYEYEEVCTTAHSIFMIDRDVVH